MARHRTTHGGGLRLVELHMGLSHVAIPSSPWIDSGLILISIDLEFRINSFNVTEIRELGLSSFDTRKLRPYLSQCEKDDLIQTVQVPIRQTDPREVISQKPSKECVFGPTMAEVAPTDLITVLRTAIQYIDDHDPDLHRFRNVALVGHNVHCDLSILKNYGFNLLDFPFIIGVVDTDIIAKSESELLSKKSLPHPARLGNVLKALQIPFLPHELHSAGNDAIFALYALLKMVERDVKPHTGLTAIQKEKLELLHAITPKRKSPRTPAPAVKQISYDKTHNSELDLYHQETHKSQVELERQWSGTSITECGSISPSETVQTPIKRLKPSEHAQSYAQNSPAIPVRHETTTTLQHDHLDIFEMTAEQCSTLESSMLQPIDPIFERSLPWKTFRQEEKALSQVQKSLQTSSHQSSKSPKKSKASGKTVLSHNIASSVSHQTDKPVPQSMPELRPSFSHTQQEYIESPTTIDSAAERDSTASYPHIPQLPPDARSATLLSSITVYRVTGDKPQKKRRRSHTTKKSRSAPYSSPSDGLPSFDGTSSQKSRSSSGETSKASSLTFVDKLASRILPFTAPQSITSSQNLRQARVCGTIWRPYGGCGPRFSLIPEWRLELWRKPLHQEVHSESFVSEEKAQTFAEELD